MSAPHEIRARKGDVRPTLGFTQHSGATLTLFIPLFIKLELGFKQKSNDTRPPDPAASTLLSMVERA